MKWLGKLIKGLSTTVLVLVLLLLAAVLSVPLWIGAVVRPVANRTVPEYTGTAFNIGRFALNPYTCRMELEDLTLANPPGFSDPLAFQAGRATLDLDIKSLFEDVLVVEEVELCGVYVSYVRNREKKYNFDVIARNVKRKLGIDCPEPPPEEGMALPDLPDLPDLQNLQNLADPANLPSMPELSMPSMPFGGGDPDRRPFKLIIRRFVISDVSGNYQSMPFRIPGFELRDLGADSGGYEIETMEQALLKELVASIMASVGDLLGGALSAGGKLGGKSLDVVTNLNGTGQAVAEAIRNIDVSTAGNSVKFAGEAVGNAGEATVSAVGTAGQVTVAAVGNAGQTAVNAVSNVNVAVVGDAVEAAGGAIGSATKMAADAVRGIDKSVAGDTVRYAGQKLGNAGQAALNAIGSADASAEEALKNARHELKHAGKALKKLLRNSKSNTTGETE